MNISINTMISLSKRKIRAILIILALTACVPSTRQFDLTLLADTETPIIVTNTNPPEYTPIIEAEPKNIPFWASQTVPRRIYKDLVLPPGWEWANGALDEAVILEVSSFIPPNSVILADIVWSYVLVAPFKTVQDDVNEDDLRAAWRGSPQETCGHLTQLLTYAGDYNALVNLLGDTPGGDVISKTITIIDDDVRDISELLSQTTWALVPFDRLQPKYKVISIDGISPLDDAFSQHSYPLTGSYALYTSPDTFDRFPDANINLLKEGLPKTNRDENKITTLIMTGVTALVRATAYRMETMGITYPGLDIADWLQNADITHISNEVVFSEKCPYPDPISTSLAFCSKTDYLDLFTYVGADVIELTGNHINDTSRRFGDPFAFAETLALYDDYNMLYYGGGMDKNLAQQPAIIQHNGHKIAFIGCNSPGPDFAWAAEGQEGAAPCEDFTWLITEVERLKTEGYLPVVTIQYGEDYTNYASQKMKAEFQQIAASGAVIVNGSQAHTPKEFEFYQGSFIHYGLGNLFFDQMYTVINGISYPQTRWEFIQKHVFYNGKYLSTELLTAMLEDYSRPRPMTIEERQIFLQSIFSINQ